MHCNVTWTWSLLSQMKLASLPLSGSSPLLSNAAEYVEKTWSALCLCLLMGKYCLTSYLTRISHSVLQDAVLQKHIHTIHWLQTELCSCVNSIQLKGRLSWHETTRKKSLNKIILRVRLYYIFDIISKRRRSEMALGPAVLRPLPYTKLALVLELAS